MNMNQILNTFWMKSLKINILNIYGKIMVKKFINQILNHMDDRSLNYSSIYNDFMILLGVKNHKNQLISTNTLKTNNPCSLKLWLKFFFPPSSFQL